MALSWTVTVAGDRARAAGSETTQTTPVLRRRDGAQPVSPVRRSVLALWGHRLGRIISPALGRCTVLFFPSAHVHGYLEMEIQRGRRQPTKTCFVLARRWTLDPTPTCSISAALSGYTAGCYVSRALGVFGRVAAALHPFGRDGMMVTPTRWPGRLARTWSEKQFFSACAGGDIAGH
jgi:hypothetical protein